MAFSFRDNFTGAANVDGALIGHTPDTFVDSVKLAAIFGDASDSLSGTGIFYSSSATGSSVALTVNSTGPTTVASPLSVIAEQLQGWLRTTNLSTTLPVSDSQPIFAMTVTPNTGGFAGLELSFWNRSTGTTVAENISTYGYTLPSGASVALKCSVPGRGEIAFAPLKIPVYVGAVGTAAPFDLKLTSTSTRAAVRVNNVLLLETDELPIGDMTTIGANGIRFFTTENVGVSAFAVNSDTLGPGSLNFWTGFVETAETQ